MGGFIRRKTKIVNTTRSGNPNNSEIKDTLLTESGKIEPIKDTFYRVQCPIL